MRRTGKPRFYELQNVTCTVDRDAVLRAVDCRTDSPVYEEVSETYDEICAGLQALLEPVGVLGFGELPARFATETYRAGTPVVYAVTSVGDGVKRASTQAFDEGDYIRGMLADAIADEALFSMEGQLLDRLREACAEHGLGVLARLEAPHDIPMEVQREAWEYLDLERRFGIGISSGFMFYPLKTTCQIFVLTEDEARFRAEHDCRRCPNVGCRRRHIPDTKLTVQNGEQRESFFIKAGESVLEGLTRQGYVLHAPCGGNGSCRKCRVRIVRGTARIGAEDEQAFSPRELELGWRLACRLYPSEDLEINVPGSSEMQFEAVAEYGTAGGGVREPQHAAEACGKSFGRSVGKVSEKSKSYHIAIDVGTTTLAFALLDAASGRTLHSVTAANSQRAYGADVISRIQAAADGKAEALQEAIRADLRGGCTQLLREAGVSEDRVRRIAVSGNTTMGHLLMGYDCAGLGQYPFTPVNLELLRGTDRELLGFGNGQTEVTLLPGISAYVGGDIVSGLYANGFAQSEETSLLIDLGTNGEMALGNRNRILVTSTAAGPAFEGGCIEWGMGSVAGAICSVRMDGGSVGIETIRGASPEGICGTGVVEATAELVRTGIVDETGAIDEAYAEHGFPLARTADGRQIVFTQKDVREIQLAKAAVRAGMETLLLRYGIPVSEVKCVYLAGGFGYRLDANQAVAIGMLPEVLRGRIYAVGNSSLAGAAAYLHEENAEQTLAQLIRQSEEIGLSADPDFNEFYMEAMFFPEQQ